MKFIKYFLVTLSLLIAANAKAAFFDRAALQVSQIEVSEIADSAELARSQALKVAQRNAFDKLVEDLFGEDFVYEASDDEIEGLVEAISINDEVITDRNYSAKIDVKFSEQHLKYFVDDKLLHVKKEVPKILIVPVYSENGFFKLWQFGNKWLRTLQNAEYAGGVVRIYVPRGDLSDINNFILEEFADYTDERIAALKEYYRVDKIILASVFYEYNYDLSEIKTSIYLDELGEQNNSTILSSNDLEYEDDLDQQLQDYATLLIKQLNDAWINYANLTVGNMLNEQDFVFRSNSVNAYETIKNRLNKIEFIEDWQLKSVSAKYVTVTLHFKQSPFEVVEQLRGQGFDIARQGEHLIVQDR